MFRIILYVSCTTCWYVNLSKNLRFLAIAAAKVRTFSKLPNVSEENLKSFFWSAPAVGILLSIANLIPYSDYLRSSCWLLPFSLECGCKSTALQHNFQIFLQLFFHRNATGLRDALKCCELRGKLFFKAWKTWKQGGFYYYIMYGIRRGRHDSASFLSVRDCEEEGAQKEGGGRNNQIIQ